MKRFNLSSMQMREERVDGEYVLYADVEALVAENKALHEANGSETIRVLQHRVAELREALQEIRELSAIEEDLGA
jgi:hypothetical protein